MLTISSQTINALTCRTACLVLPVFSGKKMSAHAAGELGKLVTTLQKRGDIAGKPGDSLLLPHAGNIAAERLLLVGAGDGKPLTRTQYLSLLNTIADHLHKVKAKDAVLLVDEIGVQGRDHAWCAELAARQLANSCYRFDTLKKDKKPAALQKLTWHTSDKKQQKAIDHGLASGRAVAGGMALARELGNLPGNVCTPTYLASQAQQLARGKKNLSVKVLEEKQMRELKMGSLLSVSAGSDEPAKLVILDYKGGAKNAKPVVLVGKGDRKSVV